MTDSDLVEELNEIGFGLTEWEVDFIESINTVVDNGRSLTERQREVAERILEEKG